MERRLIDLPVWGAVLQITADIPDDDDLRRELTRLFRGCWAAGYVPVLPVLPGPQSVIGGVLGDVTGSVTTGDAGAPQSVTTGAEKRDNRCEKA